MFNLIKKIRRKRIGKKAFPEEWKALLQEKVVHYHYLDYEEKEQLEQEQGKK